MIIGQGYAPGKIILMGEHSVVYGKPAISLPFYSVSVKVEVIKTDGKLEIESHCYQGEVNQAPKTIKGIQKLIHITLEHLNQEAKHLKIRIHSSIPDQRGLGSSAAVSVAIVRALFDAFKMPLSKETLKELVHVAEEIHHRNPSGLDANTILQEELLMFDKTNGIQKIDAKLSGYLVVCDTGIKGNTKASVDNVKELLKTNPKETVSTIECLGELTLRTKQHIIKNDLEALGQAMTKSHQHLRKLGVSNTTLDIMVDTALVYGALGAKLTGGGNGGCIIALSDQMVDAKNIADALLQQNAAHTWIYQLSEV